MQGNQLIYLTPTLTLPHQGGGNQPNHLYKVYLKHNISLLSSKLPGPGAPPERGAARRPECAVEPRQYRKGLT
jgi:hypothetical protein